MKLTKKLLKFNDQEIICEYTLKARNVVILHGAGQSDRTRYYPFAQEILKQGNGVVLFDFKGHGESTGELEDSSLKDRQEQAASIIETLLPKDSKFTLIGFSMSGETVCNLLPLFPERIKTILLGCPAVYTKEAMNLKFKDDQFKSLIRTNDSWKNSTALQNLAQFNGRTFITYGNKDEIIPKKVIDTLRNVAKNVTYNEYENVSHALAVWLGEHPIELEKLVKELIQDPKAS